MVVMSWSSPVAELVVEKDVDHALLVAVGAHRHRESR